MLREKRFGAVDGCSSERAGYFITVKADADAPHAARAVHADYLAGAEPFCRRLLRNGFRHFETNFDQLSLFDSCASREIHSRFRNVYRPSCLVVKRGFPKSI